MSTGNASQFLGSLPVGSIIQSPANIADPTWLRCDGSIIARATYPSLSAAMPGVGTFTPTSRVLVSAPANAAIAASGVNVVVPGIAGVTGIQYSSNSGVSWTAATTPSSFQVAANGLVNTGSAYFALGGGINTGAYSPNLTGAGAWTASTAITNSPTTCATNGAGVVLCPVGNSMNYSSNGGTSFSQYAITAAGGAGSPIVWTGTAWVLFCASATAGVGVQTSTTGLVSSWTAQFSVPWGANAITSACSDGAGNILAVTLNSSVAWVSNNSGITWRETLLPTLSNGSCSYANGRWFASTYTVYGANTFADGSMSVSSDLLSWIFVPVFSQMALSGNSPTPTFVAYSGGNYISLGQLSSAVVTTLTENTTQMYLPKSMRSGSTSAGTLVGVTNWQEWIKAA